MRRKRHDAPNLPAGPGLYPVVAVLGRPNVGKSTLFNRLVGRQVAIVEDQPGVTRDRLFADAEVTGRRYTLVDMGGFEVAPDDPIAQGINQQCLSGVDQADLVLFVVDGQAPLTKDDFETATMLRRRGRPCLLVVNKVDGQRQESEAAEAYRLGLGPVINVSALHGRGFADLEDEIYARLPAESELREDDDEGVVRLAVLGRPNAGKSSLVNCLLGEDRLLTSAIPGTTRDPVDSMIEIDGQRYVVVDTAGIRRKRAVPDRGPEKLAVTAAVRTLDRCHVAVVLVDASGGMAEQDAKVLGLAVERGRAVVIAYNKWDLVRGDAETQKRLAELRESLMSFAPWASTVHTSALTGQGLGELLARVREAHAEFGKRVSTGQLNRLFEDIVEHHPPPLGKNGRPIKLFYATQVSVRPPTFVVSVNHADGIHFSYRRYVQNRIREAFGFQGSPVRVIFRQRNHRSREE